MTPPFQVASLVASPSYPNSIAWSDDNLVAVATGHIVTILNPQKPHSPRGLITLAAADPYPIGVVERNDLFSSCLLPICLSRDRQPYIRSISWSPLGFGSNYGCLLVVCTSEGHVKIYRQPYAEFCSEWVEVVDISDMLYSYMIMASYGEPAFCSSNDSVLQVCKRNSCADGMRSTLNRERKRRKYKELDSSTNPSSVAENFGDANGGSLQARSLIAVAVEVLSYPACTFQKGSYVEVLKLDGSKRLWVSGKVEQMDGLKALISCSAYEDGKQKWVDISPNGVNMQDVDDYYPQIRPVIDAGNLPPQILIIGMEGVAGILNSGQAVEAWSDSRWVEGAFVGISNGEILTKFYGADNAAALQPNLVRLAPMWIREENLWQITSIKVQKGEEHAEVLESQFRQVKGDNWSQVPPASTSGRHSSRSIPESSNLQHITAREYSSRNALLSSLAVAWSPEVSLSEATHDDPCNSCYCLLAVGSKSGKISYWKFCKPEIYSINKHVGPTQVMLLSHLQVHEAWITALGWGILDNGTSNPQLILTTGSSDGSVKSWLGLNENLLNDNEFGTSPFSLLKEVTSDDSAPVTAISLTICNQSSHKIILAVGRGSGSLEVWTLDVDRRNLQNIRCVSIHDSIITGLDWAFGGRCLYSCSQDNSLRGWKFDKGVLTEIPIPPNNLEIRLTADLPCVFDSCFGVSVSPGNLVLAVVRSFDPDMLNPMYQARTQRAAVEFFWLGGQELISRIPSRPDLESDRKAPQVFTVNELVSWGFNMLWSLNQYVQKDKYLVVWDATIALSAFKQCAPEFLSQTLSDWIASLMGDHFNNSPKSILLEAAKSLAKISSRHLQLLNILIRRVILSGLNPDKVNAVQLNPMKLSDTEDDLWMKLLLKSEKELRERLVAFGLAYTLFTTWNPNVQEDGGCRSSFGVLQMLTWVGVGQSHVNDELSHLSSEVAARLKLPVDSPAEESCIYCCSPVSFESPEHAFCQGKERADGEAAPRHQIMRCAISMQVCPSSSPLWVCVCCERRAFRLAPRRLYSLPNSLQDFQSLVKSMSRRDQLLVPLCPFCGIVLQRLLPDFLLSPSPV